MFWAIFVPIAKGLRWIGLAAMQALAARRFWAAAALVIISPRIAIEYSRIGKTESVSVPTQVYTVI